MVKESMDFLIAQDPEVGQAIRAEYDRQQQNIELIASENVVSSAVLAAAGTVLTNKYAEGLPGKRYYGGCEFVDVAENLARDRLKELFGCEHCNVQPHSGAQANFAVYFAMEYCVTAIIASLIFRRINPPQIVNRMSWTLHCAHSTAQADRLFYHCTVICNPDCPGRTGLLADSTANTADFTLFFCLCPFTLI